VIVADFLIVIDWKVEGHLMIVEKSKGEEMIHLLLEIWKTCS
jgi:hypothetical protein